MGKGIAVQQWYPRKVRAARDGVAANYRTGRPDDQSNSDETIKFE